MSSLTKKQRVNFSTIKNPVKYPDFLEVQLKSFRDFFQLDTPADKRKNEGLYKVFSEIEVPVTLIVADMEDSGITMDLDFTEKLNQDKINFYNKWTHAKTKLGAPLLFSELSEDEATNIEGAKMFFVNNPEEERRYIFLRDEFAKTLNGTDREIYYLLEKGITQKEIAKRLNVSVQTVSNRKKMIHQKLRFMMEAYLTSYICISVKKKLLVYY